MTNDFQQGNLRTTSGRSLPLIRGNGKLGVLIALAVLLFVARDGWSQVSTRLDVNDVSFLWPAPRTADEANALITIDETGPDGVAFWPKEAFQQVLATAPTVQIMTGLTNHIVLEESISTRAAWKIAGVRIDPSAPGTDESIALRFGSMPQIRLIVQPVTIGDNGQVRVHDLAAHLVFSYGDQSAAPTPGAPRRGTPDKAKFKQVVDDLLTLKNHLEARGIRTGGPLTVHPGFQVPEFKDELRTFLKKHLSATRLQAIAFMGVEPPEPWIFFAMAKQNGAFVRVSDGQMLTFRGLAGGSVMPALPTSTFGPGNGVSTAALFGPTAQSRLDLAAINNASSSELQALRNRDIPDIIANPRISNFFNTDCVSCHTESTRRKTLNTSSGRKTFKQPDGISGVDDALLPIDKWNVRNFGWFPPMTATVTQRTANEAAESADFINREYLGAGLALPRPTPSQQGLLQGH